MCKWIGRPEQKGSNVLQLWNNGSIKYNIVSIFMLIFKTGDESNNVKANLESSETRQDSEGDRR